MNRRRLVRRTAGIALLTVLAAPAICPGVQGTLIQKDGRRQEGDLRWHSLEKEYVVTSGNRQMRVNPSMVAGIDVPEPPGLQEAIRNVELGNYNAALSVLTDIMKEYRRLKWDTVAARYAAEAHLGNGAPGEAVTLCERLIAVNPSAQYEGEVASMYWKALVEAGREDKLEAILEEAIKKGPRPLAALAQVRRGDIDFRKGNFEDALIDGYLRTVLMYTQQKRYQPEALFKAAQCFDKINRPAKAEEMRKTLLAQYPDSEYSTRARVGK